MPDVTALIDPTYCDPLLESVTDLPLLVTFTLLTLAPSFADAVTVTFLTDNSAMVALDPALLDTMLVCSAMVSPDRVGAEVLPTVSVNCTDDEPIVVLPDFVVHVIVPHPDCAFGILDSKLLFGFHVHESPTPVAIVPDAEPKPYVIVCVNAVDLRFV